jgi:2-polyprenyl-3-methyl-5-hydroxy-6-metoxy-1,4-benzoquinol methylase
MKKKPEQIPWYVPEGSFFDKDFLNQYREFLNQERTQKEVIFIEKVLKLKPKMKILDLACGWGRHSIEFARRGYKVVGQDINPLFLKEAKKAAEKAKVKIHWMKLDMRKIPFKKEFDVVLNLFTSFGYFKSEEDHQKIIFEIAKALKPKGFFFLDVINRENLIHKPKFREQRKFNDDSLLIMERKFDLITSYLREKRIYIKNRKRRITHISLRLFTLTELISMCQKAGLRFRKSYGDYKGEPIDFNTDRCILITQKI